MPPIVLPMHDVILGTGSPGKLNVSSFNRERVETRSRVR